MLHCLICISSNQSAISLPFTLICKYYYGNRNFNANDMFYVKLPVKLLIFIWTETMSPEQYGAVAETVARRNGMRNIKFYNIALDRRVHNNSTWKCANVLTRALVNRSGRASHRREHSRPSPIDRANVPRWRCCSDRRNVRNCVGGGTEL